MKKLVLFIGIFLLVSFVSAGLEIRSRTSDNQVLNLESSASSSVNYSTANVNNSDYLDGYDWTTTPNRLWWYNQTTPALNYCSANFVKKSGDNMTGDLYLNEYIAGGDSHKLILGYDTKGEGGIASWIDGNSGRVRIVSNDSTGGDMVIEPSDAMFVQKTNNAYFGLTSEFGIGTGEPYMLIGYTPKFTVDVANSRTYLSSDMRLDSPVINATNITALRANISYVESKSVMTPLINNTNNVTISPSGHVTLFNTQSVGNTVDGNSLFIYRNAPEGLSWIRLYNDQYTSTQLRTSGSFLFNPGGDMTIYAGSENVNVKSEGTHTTYFNQYGYISAAGAQKTVTFRINKSDGYYELFRQDANVTGFKIDMPVVVKNNLTINGNLRVVGNINLTGCIQYIGGTLGTCV